MSDIVKEARDKLEREHKAAKYDQYARIMKDGVKQTLVQFCEQSEVFAERVAHGKSFEECMKAVAKGINTPGLPDEVAYKRAVKFYMPEAKIRVHMEIFTGSAPVPERERPAAEPVRQDGIVDLSAFL